MKDLFGTTNAVSIPDLPTHLNEVYERIKHFEIPSINQLIKEHTLFRYYTAFQPNSVRYSILTAMKKENQTSSVYMMTGIAASMVKEWDYFRFCPTCIQEDTINKGEPYWHVSHQKPGVFMCMKHGDYLCDSSVEFRNGNKHEFVAASEENCIPTFKSSPFPKKVRNHLAMIVEQCNQLLIKDLSFTLNNIQKAYKYLLMKNGLANINGKISQQKLAEQFRLFYGEELLNILNSSVDYGNSSCWLKKITRKHRNSFHPLRHILFIHFLSESIETIYKFSQMKNQPFGEGPYYCLNPAAMHYKERVVTELNISLCNDTKRPVGTFVCSCDFVYSRRGPDELNGDKYKIGRVKKFGSVWKEKVHQLVHIEKKSLYAAAKELKCDIGTIKKYATKNTIQGEKISNAEKFNIKTVKQNEWLQLVIEHPSHSITLMRKIAPALYMWHYRNNREWLQKNSSKQRNAPLISQRIDWADRDIEVLQIVTEVTNSLIRVSKPEFINKSRIGREVGRLALLEKHLDKMPKTKQYLECHIESRETFQIRRIIWACKILKDCGQDVVAWRVKRLAGIREDMNYLVLKSLEEEILKYKEGEQNIENQTMAIFERNSDSSLAWECFIEEQSMVHTDWLYM